MYPRTTFRKPFLFLSPVNERNQSRRNKDHPNEPTPPHLRRHLLFHVFGAFDSILIKAYTSRPRGLFRSRGEIRTD